MKLTPPTPDLTRLAAQWRAEQAALSSAAALTNVTVVGKGGVLPGGVLTATIRRAFPDHRVEIALFSQEGAPLLRYTESGGRYTVVHAGDPAPNRGALVPPPATTRNKKRADPVALALDGLSHVLAGAAGIDLSAGRVGVTRKGAFAVTGPAGTIRFSVVEGRLVSLAAKRPRSRIGPADLSFADWRPTGGAVYPYRVDVAFPKAGVTVLVDVVEWAVEKAPGPETGTVRPVTP